MTRVSGAPSMLITGASSGIGQEFARQYAARNYHLVLDGRKESALTRDY